MSPKFPFKSLQSHLKPCHLLGKCDDSEDPGNVHPDRLGEVFVEADGCRTVEHYVHLVVEFDGYIVINVELHKSQDDSDGLTRGLYYFQK